MNPGNPVPSPEQQEALRAQKEAGMEAKIAQHRAANPDAAVSGFNEAAQSHKQVEQETKSVADRQHHLERRLNDQEPISGSRKLSDLNEQARMEIWGSGKATYKKIKQDGEPGKRVQASPDNPEEGVLEGIRNNSGDYRNDRVFGKGQRERMEKADKYEKEVLRLIEEEGLEPVQAKLYMDLGIEADEQRVASEAKAKILQGKLEAQGNSPDQAKDRALKKLGKELEGSEAGVHKDRRLEIIKEFGKKGVFTRKEYEEAKKEFTDQGGDVTKPNEPKPEAAPAPEDPTDETTELRDIVNDGANNTPPNAPEKTKLRDRFRNFCVRLAHGGGEKGDKARKALRYGALGLIGASAVVGVNNVVDGDHTISLYEMTGIDLGSGDGSHHAQQHHTQGAESTIVGGDNVADSTNGGTEFPSATPEQFNVENGHGFTHEIMDYAHANGKDITPEEAYRIYEHLEGEHGANLINVLGDSDKTNTYLMGDGNYGIDAPGKAVWANGVEDTIRHDLSLPAADAGASPVGLSGNEAVATSSGSGTEASHTNGNPVTGVVVEDDDPLAENIALGATGFAVGAGSAYVSDRLRGKNNGSNQSAEASEAVRSEAERRALALQNHALELNQRLSFVMSQLPEKERARIVQAWQQAQEQARRQQEGNR